MFSKVISLLFTIFLSINHGYSKSYLNRNMSRLEYHKLADTKLLTPDTYAHPFNGIACGEYNELDDYNYFITSSRQYTSRYNDKNYKCSYSKKYVEILKYNHTTNNVTDSILLGEKTSNYPQAILGKTGDNVVSCGIDKQNNYLYFINSNINECDSHYGMDSSLIRINLNNFTFKDRTFLNSFTGIDPFSKYDYSKYKYINHPTTSQLDENNNLWIGFGTIHTGVWRLSLSNTNISLDLQYQKKYMTTYEYEMITGSNHEYETNIKEIKKSFINKNKTTIYFVEDTLYSNAKVLIINYSKPVNDNTTSIVTLDGINYISDIELDESTKKIYLVSGSLSSELYQLDYNFNKLSLTATCNVDFLKFPTQWGIITNIVLDSNAGYIYAFPSIRYGNNGLVRINIKDMSIQYDSFIRFEVINQQGTNKYTQYLVNLNVTTVNLNDGFIIIAPNQNSYNYYFIKYYLFGCSKGRGVLNSTCESCEPGKFSNVIGGLCEDCFPGYASSIFESSSCLKCDKGTYTTGKHTINCLDCPAGFYIDKLGSDSCKHCNPGKYSIISKSKTKQNCLICQKGKVSEKGSVECKFCEIGEWTEDNKNCHKCKAGKFSPNIGISSSEDCLLCPTGKYSDEKGLTSVDQCKSCPDGHIGITDGAHTNTSCVKCDRGKFKISDIECEICADGSVSMQDRIQCSICDVGKFSNLYKIFCEDCPVGKFNNKIGMNSIDDCLDCPRGRWSKNISLTNIDHCIRCPPGYYGNEYSMTTVLSCKPCPSGKFNSNYGLSNEYDCRECSTGSSSTQGSIECNPCDAGKYALVMGSSECLWCPEGKYSSSNSTYLCSNCPDNSQQNDNKTYCVCSENSYNERMDGLLDCKMCNDTFTCPINTNIETIVLKQNYWRENSLSHEIYKCKNRFACKGGVLVNSSDNLCNEGFKGPLCNVCEKGWAKDDGICLKCPDNVGRTLSLTIIIPIVCVLIIIFLIKTANPSNNKKEEVNGVVKIFMNYAQVFSLASSFQINWPTMIRYLFERAKEFSSPRVSFYSSDCAIGWTYYDKLLVYLVLPLAYMVVVTFVIFCISLCYCQKKKKKMKKMKTQLEIKEYMEKSPTCWSFFIAWEKTAIVVGTFLSWPTIVQKTLEVLNCEKIGDKYYLVKDYSVTCYDSQHYTYLIVAYVSLVLYGIGIPLLGFRLLYNYRFRLFDMQNRYDGSTPLSFLFLGYREKRWYYEFIIMGKKAGLILLSVFLKSHPRYQIIAASLLVQISFFLHVFMKPYDTITSYGMICNKLESISLLSLVMTLSTGLFFGTIDSGYELGTFEDILIIILILCNGGITLYFISYFVTLGCKASKNHLKEHLNKHFKNDEVPFIIRCLSESKIEWFKNWSQHIDKENYGIHLKNQLEKQIFSNYFKEKKDKLSVLNDKLDNMKHKRLSVKLDRLRSQIQVMEKERCWQTIQNNRLYGDLKKTTMLNKSDLSDKETEELNNIFKLYIKQGITYNKKMNNLYMSELTGMISRDSDDSQNSTESKSPRNVIISRPSIEMSESFHNPIFEPEDKIEVII